MKTTEFIVKTSPVVNESADVKEAAPAIPEMMQFNEAAAEYAFNKLINEMATGGASSAGGVATVVAGGGKPGTGKPKKVGNSVKKQKIQVGKGVY